MTRRQTILVATVAVALGAAGWVAIIAFSRGAALALLGTGAWLLLVAIGALTATRKEGQ